MCFTIRIVAVGCREWIGAFGHCGDWPPLLQQRCSSALRSWKAIKPDEGYELPPVCLNMTRANSCWANQFVRCCNLAAHCKASTLPTVSAEL